MPVPHTIGYELVYDILVGSDTNRNDFPLMVSTDTEVFSTTDYSDITGIV
jgi:hypothetical protein